MVINSNTINEQLAMFPEPTLTVRPSRETRDDVHKGEVAENIVMLALKLAGYNCLPSMQGKKYDFGVEVTSFEESLKAIKDSKGDYHAL